MKSAIWNKHKEACLHGSIRLLNVCIHLVYTNQNDWTTESLRLEKTSKSKTQVQPHPTLLCPLTTYSVPRLYASGTTPGLVTPPTHWAAVPIPHFSWRRNSSQYPTWTCPGATWGHYLSSHHCYVRAETNPQSHHGLLLGCCREQ